MREVSLRWVLVSSCVLAVAASLARAQPAEGELRLAITDSGGLPAPAHVTLSSAVNQYAARFTASADGRITAQHLPFGVYSLTAVQAGFAPVTRSVEIRSAVPLELKIALDVAPVSSSVTVGANSTLVDPHRTNTMFRLGEAAIDDRVSAPPGRSLSALVLTEPGWVAEANGILHPRASEYQVQYVVDGMPLTDNRSAVYTADLDAASVQEMSILTAGYPAEYGRKLGGVVEVVTSRDRRPGFHGKAVASGGSFNTAGGYAEGQEAWGRNTFSASLSADLTDRYLDPPVTQNFTNRGTVENGSAEYERDIDSANRVTFLARRDQSKFEVPDELVQQQAGQRQDRNNVETAGQFSWQHVISPDAAADVLGMVRDLAAGFWSNPLSTPMLAGQNRSYREAYAKAAVSDHHGRHQLKAGAETDFASLREAFNYLITDPALFDPGTPPAFRFSGGAQDREQAAFVEDQASFGNLTLSAGLRFDHYGLLVHQSAWSPRFGAAYYIPRADLILRFSYDRVFQTPAFENLLVSSSPLIESLSPQVLRLPVRPSLGNFYEAGFSKGFFGRLRIDGNFYRRSMTNYADDNLLLNTGISFPISFSRALIEGEEVKLELPHWGRWSGFVSYANSRGDGFFPVTGGLFLGAEAASAVSATSGVFPVSQDQRNTARARVRYDISSRVWAAFGSSYDSGLPVDFNGTYAQAAAQYGANILARVSFSDYRARPALTFDASAGATLAQSDRGTLRFQIDGINLANQLDVIDFAGLFSGTALAAPRMVDARLEFNF